MPVSESADGLIMKRTQDHPSLDVVELYLLNRVNQSEEQEVEEHLLVCGQCRSMADALEEEINLIKAAMKPLFDREGESHPVRLALAS